MAPYFLWPWHFIPFVVCLFVGMTIVLASDSSSVCKSLRNNEVEVVVIGPYNNGLLLIGNDGRALEVEKKLENNKLTLKEISATTAKNLLYDIELNFDLSAEKYFLLNNYLGHVVKNFGQKEAKLLFHPLRQSSTKPVKLKELLDTKLNSRNQLIISGRDQALVMDTKCGSVNKDFCQAGIISMVEKDKYAPIKPVLTWENPKCGTNCIGNVTLEARSALYMESSYLKLYIFAGNIVWLQTSESGALQHKNLNQLLVCSEKSTLDKTQLICICIFGLLLIAMAVLFYQCNLQTPGAHNVRLAPGQRKAVHLSDSVSEDSEQVEEWKKKREKRKKVKKKSKPQKKKKLKKVVHRKKKKVKKIEKNLTKEESDQAASCNPTFTKSSADPGHSFLRTKMPPIRQQSVHNQRQSPSLVALDNPNSADKGRTNLSSFWNIFGNSMVGNGQTKAPLHTSQTASSTVIPDIDSNEFVSAQEMLSDSSPTLAKDPNDWMYKRTQN